MMTWRRCIPAHAPPIFVPGCRGITTGDFAGFEPRLAIEEYFAGETRAWGLFEDRYGAVRRQFAVDIAGKWDGSELVLDERFVYKDGGVDRRAWRIRKLGDGRCEGRADDVVGIAIGAAAGNALHWRYDLLLKVGDRRWRVRLDDWMFLQDHEILINRAVVRKWGVVIGTATIVFRRHTALAASATLPPDPA
jgi:hypothetical protein